MREALIIGVGGFIGAIARFKLGGWVLRYWQDSKFPMGTFVVNVLGCFVAGVLAGLAERHDFFPDNVRLFLFAGILGGFTTFSAFELETITLLRRGAAFVALANVVLGVVVAALALLVGLKLSELIRP